MPFLLREVKVFAKLIWSQDWQDVEELISMPINTNTDTVNIFNFKMLNKCQCEYS